MEETWFKNKNRRVWVTHTVLHSHCVTAKQDVLYWMLMAAEMECWALHNGIYQPPLCARGAPPHPAGPAARLWWSCIGWEVFSNSHHPTITTSTGCGGHPRAELASLITLFSSFLCPADHTMKDGRWHQRLINGLYVRAGCSCLESPAPAPWLSQSWLSPQPSALAWGRSTHQRIATIIQWRGFHAAVVQQPY